MVKLASITPEDFATLDPAQLRAAAQIDQRLQLGPGDVKYMIAADEQNGGRVEIPLDFEPAPLGSDDLTQIGRVYTGRKLIALQLTDAARRRWPEVQALVRKPKGYYKQRSMVMSVGMSKFPPELLGTTTRVSVYLRLKRGDGYFTMLDEAPVPLKKPSA